LNDFAGSLQLVDGSTQNPKRWQAQLPRASLIEGFQGSRDYGDHPSVAKDALIENRDSTLAATACRALPPDLGSEACWSLMAPLTKPLSLTARREPRSQWAPIGLAASIAAGKKY
jgi:hypothetical protein